MVTVHSVLEVVVVRKSDDHRRVFGWGLLSRTKAGEVIVDTQEDMTEPEDMEEAAYSFAKHGRVGGEMHEGEARARLIESMAFTPEKIQTLGIPPNTVPVGLWVGFEVPEATAKRVQLGERLMFSIQGRASQAHMVDVIETVAA